jgi:hypothetical protein
MTKKTKPAMKKPRKAAKPVGGKGKLNKPKPPRRAAASSAGASP